MMKAAYYIFFALNWLVTLLPLRILYITSDFLYYLLYYILSYRKKVVFENLRNSFPEKGEEEITELAKKYYRHFGDLIVEVLKLTHMSHRELKKRMDVVNPEIIEKIYDSGRDIAAVISHYNNWEWLGTSYVLYTRYKAVSVYKPIQNKFFNTFINDLRKKNGAGLAPMNKIVRNIVENKKNNVRSIYGFISDQTPARVEIQYYTTFLNQETPVFLGIEKLASKYDMAVVFMSLRKVKRGHYQATAELLFETTKDLPEYAVTEAHVKKLDELIRENPEYWIWSHRRWKYKKSDQ